ncbi:MAG: alpha/beta fold hydrolase [Thermodesulfobacteriota bacterium]
MSLRLPLVITALILLSSCVSFNEPPTTWNQYISAATAEKPVDLYYEIYGAGNPIIFLHGLGGNLYTWRYLVKAFEAHYQLILFDLKGAGKSPKPYDTGYSMFDQAELIYQFILQKNLRNVILVGHSFGGGVALLVALKLEKFAPERLSRLILFDTVSYPQKLPWVVKMMRTPVIGFLGLYLIPDRIKVRKMLESIYFDDSKITAADVEAYAEPLSLPGAKFALRQAAKQIIPQNMGAIISNYPQIRVPTLIIWGRDDSIIPLQNGIRLHDNLKNSQLVIIDRCGHDPPEERPERVIEIMQKFLEDRFQSRA